MPYLVSQKCSRSRDDTYTKPSTPLLLPQKKKKNREVNMYHIIIIDILLQTVKLCLEQCSSLWHVAGCLALMLPRADVSLAQPPTIPGPRGGSLTCTIYNTSGYSRYTILYYYTAVLLQPKDSIVILPLFPATHILLSMFHYFYRWLCTINGHGLKLWILHRAIYLPVIIFL